MDKQSKKDRDSSSRYQDQHKKDASQCTDSKKDPSQCKDSMDGNDCKD